MIHTYNVDNLANYISAKIAHADSSINFLLDTGADISIIKKGVIDEDLELENLVCRIKGVTASDIYTLGTIDTYLLIENEYIKQKLHVVPNNFAIDTDAILGRDFLCNHRCKLNYEDFTISVGIKEREVVLPIKTNIPIYNEIEIPARSQVIRALNRKIHEDGIVLNQEIRSGIFIANTIVPAKGIAHIKILNTNDYKVKCKLPELKIIPVKDFHVINMNHRTNENYDKKEKIKQLLTELNI